MTGKFKNYLYDRQGNFKLPILRSPLFLGVLGLKLISSFLFASDYLYGLFLPFVKYFIENSLANPYLAFEQSGMLNVFPYPSIMLWALSLPLTIGHFLLSPAAIGHWDIFLVRLPLLIADLIIFLILCRWLKKNQHSVLLYYWCSPILFYISYIHGQLDALPIMFLFVSLYFLFKDKFYTAAAFLGLSLATKTGIIIVLPFFLVYLITKHLPLRKVTQLFLLPIGIFLLVNLNYLLAPGFYEIVLQTKEQFKIFDFQFRLGNNFTLYITPLAYLFLFFKSLSYKAFNRDVFLMFLGFSFGLLTIFIPPMPGWYFWVIPFLVYFFVKANHISRTLFWTLNVLYFAYFLAIEQSDVFEILQLSLPQLSAKPNLYAVLMEHGFAAPILVNIIFSLLQGVLLLCVWWIYQQGVESYRRHKIYSEPYLIGISGDSGSGKTTLASLINCLFGPRNVSIIAGDDLHKWERNDPNWKNRTPLDPRANELHTGLDQAREIKNGNEVERRHYDHQTGKFTLPVKIKAKKIIVFEGLHSLFLNKMRRTLDLKIFMNPDDELRQHWKISRDSAARGYNKEEVIKQIIKRAPDSERYIKTQEQYSDIVIALKKGSGLQNSLDGDNSDFDPYLEFTCSNDLNMTPLLEAVAPWVIAEHLMSNEKQTLIFRGQIDKQTVEQIGEMIIPELDELAVRGSVWREGQNGLIQLFVSYYIFQSMKI